MLVELHIENFAVVERLRLRFHHGLNLLTGETGSGKSIIVDSLGLLFGGRASAELVRSGTERARISGIFAIAPSPALRALCEEAGISLEEGELLIEREILANGKSRAFAASRPVTVALLKQLAPWLGDIHGQNEQQQLYDAVAQRGILDEFAAAQEARKSVASVFHAWRGCDRELEEITQREQEQLRLADLWSFQRKEIEALDLKPGEDEELANEKRILQNVTRLSEHAEAAFTALYDAPNSALAQARAAQRRVEELLRIDGQMAEVADLLKPAVIALEEAGRSLRDYVGHLEADPERLEAVESRLAAIGKLKRKYGASIDEILEFLASVQAKMRTVESASELRAEIEARRKKLAAEYETAAGKLTALRKQAARQLEKRVELELTALAMAGTTFRVAFSDAPWSEDGRDTVVFLVSANKGEEPKDLSKVASGGEVSRIALAIKTCVERERPGGEQHLLVFDEVDAGIGGQAAEAVGRRLKELSRAYQVLCVTHQAQIASFADAHYRVEKKESKGRTVAAVIELEGAERTKEIGRMLSGQHLTPEALQHAEQLIRAGAAV
ncbi:MAG TPA: DNA repair protein RecN [Bryobacteraceae bacterium]|nr:DNA repair protein RecN [Bryobacteraceae bacterium]